MKNKLIIIISILMIINLQLILLMLRSNPYEIFSLTVNSALGLLQNQDVCLAMHINKTIEERCYKPILESAILPIDCQKIKFNPSSYTHWRDSCYNILSRKMKDAGQCQEIISNFQKNICYSEIGSLLYDERYCAYAEDQYMETCYASVGEAKNDVSLCLKSNGFANQCIINLAYKNRDILLCEYIKHENFQDFESIKNECIKQSKGEKDRMLVR